MEIQHIGVIGAGQMGNGIAQVAACAGFKVSMIDIKQEYLDMAMANIQKSLEKLVSKDRLSQTESSIALSRINYSTSMIEVSDADLVIEAVPEILELKNSIFSKLDDICKPSTILASNTSSISIDKIANSTKRPELVIGMHFMNPVPLMRLVEIINGSKTSPEVNNLVVSAATKMGKVALSCNDSPGFVSNRILCPMLNEAILALEEGVAEPEAIDGIMKLGMNHPIGPLALADLIGLDTLLHILGVLHDGFDNDKYKPAELLVEMVSNGHLGRKSGKGFYDY
ncbi:MAG: 3-hydroxybutyryl-CoA dehydrogenase [Candidatus Poseidoniales archaeon]|nr:MAG: 3-hydroxybutyryl-CoA dehydrogenase [Candidatus Poseidoniales archaeon]